MASTQEDELEQRDHDWLVLADTPMSRGELSDCLFVSELPAEFVDGDVRPMIPVCEWSQHERLVDDVTRSPSGFEAAPEWVIEAMVEYFGSMKAAGLAAAENPMEPVSASTTEDDGEGGESPADASLPPVDEVSFTVESPYVDPTPDGKPDEAMAWAGGKDPSKLATWKRVWERSGLVLEQPLTEPYLKGAIQSVLGVRQDEAEDLIQIGETHDYLLSTTDAGTQYYGLPSPRRTPGRYLEDPLAYADPSTFQTLWTDLGYNTNEGIPENFLVPSVTASFDFVDAEYGEAIIGTALLEGLLEQQGRELYLGEARFPPFWRQVWEEAGVGFEDAIPEAVFPNVIRTAHGIADTDVIDEKASQALDHGIIWTPENGAGYRLNDPASSAGPDRTPVAGGDTATGSPPAETGTEAPGANREGAGAEQTSTSTSSSRDESGESVSGGDAPPAEDVASGGSGTVSMDDITLGGEASDSGEAREPAGGQESGPSTETGDGSNETATAVPDANADASSDETNGADHGSMESQSVKSLEERADPDDYIAPGDSETPETVRLPSTVQEAFRDAIEFLQDHLDEGIEVNALLNERAAQAGDRRRHPTTAREYFGQANTTSEDVPEDLEEFDPNTVTAVDCRGWSDEVIESAGLGYAPADEHALVKYLHWKGYDRQTMVQTGLFVDFVAANHNYQLEDIEWSDYDYPDPPSESERPADWRDHDVTRHDFDLAVHFVGRYVFPYFNEAEDPVYAISRTVNQAEGGVPEDTHGDQKYTKAVKRGTSVVDEPIYGLNSITSGDPLIITEGIADAITCHDFGIPCISPVTREFKEEHYRPLKELLEHHEIPLVYIIQDSDPASVANNPDAVPWSETDYPLAETGTYVTEDGQELPTAVSDRPHPRESVPASVARGIWGSWPAGPISEQLSIKCDGPGVEGAVATGTYLEQNLEDVEVYLIELPRFGPEKMDLDDYLQNGWLQYCPPIDWVVRNVGQGAGEGAPNESWGWLEELKDAGEMVADPRLMGAQKLADRGYSTATDDGLFVPGSAPATALFGLLPTIHPREHGLYSEESAVEMDVPGSLRAGSSGGRNALYNLTMPEVTGLSWGYRGTSPLGHHGESEDYFSMDPDRGVKDFKYGVSYSPLSFLLCRAGERKPSDPNGELSKREHFMAWLQARQDNLISEDVPVPRNGLFWVAFDEGFASSSDVERVTRSTGDGSEYTHRELPAEAYNSALSTIKNKYGEPPGRRPISTGDDAGQQVGQLHPEADIDHQSGGGFSSVSDADFVDEASDDAESPLAYFLNEYVEIDPNPKLSDDGEEVDSSDLEVPKGEFRRIYRAWCDLNDHDPVPENWMSRKLNTHLPFKFGESRPVIDGERKRAYVGFEPNTRGQALLSHLRNRTE